MIGKLFAAATGAAINKEQRGNPLTGAAVGFVTMAVARRVLPVRFAAMGATIAAGYLTKRLADRAERRAASETARARAEPAGVADSFAMLHDIDAESAAETRAAPRRRTATGTRARAHAAPAKRAPANRSAAPRARKTLHPVDDTRGPVADTTPPPVGPTQSASGITVPEPV